jgi:large subunit ribosomal protein L21
MYAVIKTGGKQQKVKAGDIVEVELTRADGDTVELQPILVVDDDGKLHYGKEAGKAVVVARLVGDTKGDKIKGFKYRPKSGYARRYGHRQQLTVLEIEDVRLGKVRTTRKKAEEAKPKAESTEPEAPAGAEPDAPAEAPNGAEPDAPAEAPAEAPNGGATKGE